jgi:spermidine/putrescine-binding protein
MNSKDVIDRMASGRMTRREFSTMLTAMGLGVVTMVGRAPAAGAAPEDLLFFTWSGYDVPEMHQSYTAKYGVSPQHAIFGGTEEAYQKLMSGFVADVSHPCVEDVVRWRESGLIKRLDESRLAHWQDLFPELFNLPGATINGEHWFIPIDWGNGSLLYRTDLVDVKEESWTVAFDEANKGKISMYDATPTVTVAALVLGINPFEFTDEEGARIKELLTKQRELVRFYWNSPSEYQQAMASGEISIAYAWNDGLAALRKQGLPVKYMNPKEGILTWTCGVVHMANAKASDEEVYDFLNAFSAPETGKFLIEEYGYGHSNRKAFEMADKTIVENLGFASPTELFAKGVFETETSPEMAQKRNDIFESVKMGG